MGCILSSVIAERDNDGWHLLNGFVGLVWPLALLTVLFVALKNRLTDDNVGDNK